MRKSEPESKVPWGIIKQNNIYIMGIPEKRRVKEEESIFEEPNFPHLMKDVKLYARNSMNCK